MCSSSRDIIYLEEEKISIYECETVSVAWADDLGLGRGIG